MEWLNGVDPEVNLETTPRRRKICTDDVVVDDDEPRKAKEVTSVY